MPTAEQLKEAFYRSEEKEPKKMNLWQMINLFQKDCGKMNNWKNATHEKIRVMENYLRDFKKNMTLITLTRKDSTTTFISYSTP